MESPNEDINWEEYFECLKSLSDDDNNTLDFLESGNQLPSQSQGLNQRCQNQLALLGTTQDISTATSSGVQEAAVALEGLREYNHDVAESRVELGDKTTEILSQTIQNQTVIKTAQSTPTDASCSEADAANLERRARKRKSDQEYRQRIKANYQKKDEELLALRQENALLLENLESAKSKIEKLEQKRYSQQNISNSYIAVFKLNFPNNEAKADAMRIAASFPGVNHVTMDTKDKELSLRGEDMDPIVLAEKLKKICSADLVSFEKYKKKEKQEEKKREGKEQTAELVKAYSIPNQHGPPPYPWENRNLYYTNPPAGTSDYHGETNLEHYTPAIIIFVSLFVFVIIIRFAP